MRAVRASSPLPGAARITQPRQLGRDLRALALAASQPYGCELYRVVLAIAGDELADRQAGRMAAAFAHGQPDITSPVLAERPQTQDTIFVRATHRKEHNTNVATG